MVRKGEQLTNSFCNTIRNWLRINTGEYLEIGSYNGYFISELAEEFPKTPMYSIEPFITDAYAVEDKEKLKKEIKENYKYNTNCFQNIIHLELKTKYCLEKDYGVFLSNVCCVLVDGSHNYNDIVIDVNFINSIKNNRYMMVVFDDLHIEDVIEGIKYFEKIFDSKISEKVYDKDNKFIYFIVRRQW